MADAMVVPEDALEDAHGRDVAVAADGHQAPKDLGTGTLAGVLAELEQGREVRDEVLHLVEGSKEFQEYEKEVDFEMNLLRLRYHNADAPMTPARRTQMQAHLHQVQLGLMQEHAETAADEFVESLSKEEIKQLSAMFDKLESADVPLQPPKHRQSGIARASAAFSEACSTFFQKLSGKDAKERGDQDAEAPRDNKAK